MHRKIRCELELLFGTIISLFGILLLAWFKIGYTISGPIMAVGKILVIISIFDYVKYRKLMRGEDLENTRLKRVVRKIKEKTQRFNH